MSNKKILSGVMAILLASSSMTFQNVILSTSADDYNNQPEPTELTATLRIIGENINNGEISQSTSITHDGNDYNIKLDLDSVVFNKNDTIVVDTNINPYNYDGVNLKIENISINNNDFTINSDNNTFFEYSESEIGNIYRFNVYNTYDTINYQGIELPFGNNPDLGEDNFELNNISISFSVEGLQLEQTTPPQTVATPIPDKVGEIAIEDMKVEIEDDVLTEDMIVEVPVKINGNPGLGSFVARHDVENGAELVSNGVGFAVTPGLCDTSELMTSITPDGCFICYDNSRASQIEDDGTLYSIKVKIPAGSKVGDTFPIVFIDCEDNFFSHGGDNSSQFIPELINGSVELVGSVFNTTTSTSLPIATTTPEPTTTTIPEPTTTTSIPTNTTTPEPTTKPTTTGVSTPQVSDVPKISLSFDKDNVKKNEEFTVIIKIENVVSDYERLALNLKYDSDCAKWIDENNGWTKNANFEDTISLIKVNSNVKEFRVKFKALKSGNVSTWGNIQVKGTVPGSSGGKLEEITAEYEVTSETVTTTTTTTTTTTYDGNGGNGGNPVNTQPKPSSTTVTTSVKGEDPMKSGDNGILPYLLVACGAIFSAFITTKKMIG